MQSDTGGGDEGHPEAGQAGADAEIEAVVHRGERRVEAVQSLPHDPPDEHSGRSDREHIAEVIVLGLVELVLHERDGGPERRHRLAELTDEGWVVVIDELRPDDRHRRRDLERGEQGSEGLWLGGGVLGDQPEHLGRRGHRREHTDSGRDGLAERDSFGHAEHLGRIRFGEQPHGVVNTGAVDGDHGVRSTRLRRNGIESALQAGAAALRDDDGGDSRIHRESA